jgi:hypothetical protein
VNCRFSNFRKTRAPRIWPERAAFQAGRGRTRDPREPGRSGQHVLRARVRRAPAVLARSWRGPALPAPHSRMPSSVATDCASDRPAGQRGVGVRRAGAGLDLPAR